MFRVRTAPTLLLVLAISVLFSTRASAEDWPHFRGPNSAGVSADSKPLPTEFSAEKNVRWSENLGDGIGCPVVAAGRVFTSAMVDEKTIGLYGFDAATGKQLWMRKWPIGDVAPVHKTNSHAATTPAADEERVYFYFATLGMVALDAKTGTDVWHKNLPVPYVAGSLQGFAAVCAG
jgi:outer membrane protein assembly factor BamB